MNIYKEFCVYITKYSGDKMPPLYIGSRATCDVLHNGYHGTVTSKKFKKIWESELRLHPELFYTVIESTHDTRQEALNSEELLQRKHNAVDSDLYINQAYANKKFSNLGRKMSDETRQKMREAKLGKKFSEEHKAAIGAARRGKGVGVKASAETKQKMSDSHKGKHVGSKNNFYGKKHSEETKQKISELSKQRTHTEETKKRIGEARKAAWANR